ncbi:uncharacterized protein LOC115337911 isoform X3 [Aquila chrysaetos chrysaetos]|uniref:uncharacterized protein LOC115337911 isoform X3 n=1 Tax=Aquila chrysaetos chrysaetos TaxID=223781 RepID=UPI001B7D3E31|nr:uncharacterized protein LOC115337911 isoform X3 [Aquila chrysaetos chrysaetos]XP_040977727.1 uncharacterized protein LOC115337911 isoform X3 [Aquila chrysaetos chrysaetos]XP_040977728.1 uncharacterized protein LOC115337911 isoform X3 [Aquila chrysaetos chrysaetos]
MLQKATSFATSRSGSSKRARGGSKTTFRSSSKASEGDELATCCCSAPGPCRNEGSRHLLGVHGCCHHHLRSPAAEPGLGFPGGESHLTRLPPAPQPYLGLLPYQVELSDGGSPSFDLHDGKVQPDPRTVRATVPTEDGGTFSPLFLSSNPAHAHLNQTALLSFSLRTPSSGWDFIHITWELISSPKNRRILTYTLDGCTGKAWNWWEQSCTVSQEVDRSYRQRAGVRPNGTLALRDVRDEDAGTYLVTVRAPDGLACVGVNLSVSREMLAAEWPSILSIIQIAAAGVVLCFLALILGEHMFWRGDKLEKTPGGTCHQSQPPPGDDSG